MCIACGSQSMECTMYIMATNYGDSPATEEMNVKCQHFESIHTQCVAVVIVVDDIVECIEFIAIIFTWEKVLSLWRCEQLLNLCVVSVCSTFRSSGFWWVHSIKVQKVVWALRLIQSTNQCKPHHSDDCVVSHFIRKFVSISIWRSTTARPLFERLLRRNHPKTMRNYCIAHFFLTLSPLCVFIHKV